MSLKKKITELFDYRMIPEFMEMGKVPNSKKLLKSMMDLQTAIYYLDAYLESEWKLKKSELQKHWKAIHQAMLDCGIPKSKLKEYAAHIRKYQSREVGLRERKFPTTGSLSYYYYYKSCDVRLMRQIVFDQSVKGSINYTMADWRYFDLITEVNDDAEDLFEDLKSINGNAILISSWLTGKKNTINRFNGFMKEIQESSQSRTSKSSLYPKIQRWTGQQVKETKKLIKHNLSELSEKRIEESVLISYWK